MARSEIDATPAPLLPRTTARFRPAAARALDLLFPPQCARCRTLVDPGGALCVECWREIDFLGPPNCACCGLPFEFDLGAGALCGACVQSPPPFARARAVMRYDDASRGLILAFKYADRTELAPVLGKWLLRAGATLAAEADLIVPVPLHWTRLFARRFNQAALLAHTVGRQAGVPVAAHGLIRRRRTPSQGRFSPSQRRRNLQGAFAVKDGARARFAGRRVLLIDDVMTTGATAAASARTLLAARAASVDVLTLARAIRAA